MTNSRRKGKGGELQACKEFNKLFGTNFYRSQQNRGAAGASDIIDDDHPELHPEVKRRQSMNLHNVMQQAREEAGNGGLAFALHRKDRERWLLTVDLEDAPELTLKLAKILEANSDE